MKDREIKSTRQKVADLLSVGRLKEALDLLGPVIHETGNGEWMREHEEVNTTYQYMLKYTLDGVEDPDRGRIYSRLVARIFRLSDRACEALLTRDAVEYIYVQKRILRDEVLRQSGDSSQALISQLISLRAANPADYNTHLNFLFRRLWLTDEYKDADVNLVMNVMESPDIPEEEKAVMVSAVNLGLWRYFDPAKFELLFGLYESSADDVRLRALVGLLLAFYSFDRRLRFYPAIRNRFLLYDEHPEFKNQIREILIQLIRSKDTEKLTRRMQEEILPEMMKLTPQLKKKLDLDKLLKESLGEDQNPEWTDFFADTPGLQDKMEELTELQMEGSDVFMSSFSMLKHFPFFSHMANWFYPFTPDHPDIAGLTTSNQEDWFKKFMEAITDSSYLCNSDKYSFCYGIQSMPDDMKKFLSDGLKAESEQMGELVKDEELLDHNRRIAKIVRQYAQDLYRFYKLFPQKNAFDDIYSWKLDVYHTSFFKDLYTGDNQILHTLAGFYFNKKYYVEAAEIYHLLEAQDEQNPDVYQKAGYCYQQLQNYQQALNQYLKADLLVQESKWNLKKIGLCYRHLGQPVKALEYFRHAENIDPEDLHTEVSIGHCLLEMKDYGGALKSYFKVEYLDPGNHKVWRPIAWCSFMEGKFDQARKYYQKLIEHKPGHFDFMNFGHLAWSEGNRSEAIELYRQSISRKEITVETFMESFEEDREHLIRFGISPDEIPIMLDHLRYTLE